MSQQPASTKAVERSLIRSRFFTPTLSPRSRARWTPGGFATSVHLVDRLEPEERRLIGIGQHIEEPVGALPDIPDPLPEIGEEPFTS